MNRPTGSHEAGASRRRSGRSSRWLRARLFAGGALLCCVGLSIVLLAQGSELDADSILPFQSSEEGTTTITGPTASDDEPSTEAQVVLSLLVAIAALPVLAPRAAFHTCLLLSMFLLGLFVVLTALHLGLLFTPVLALQAVAYVQATAE